VQGYIQKSQRLVNAALLAKLPLETLQPYDLHKAMHYAVLNGGKRLRSAFIYALGEALNVSEFILTDISLSIELIHAFSLIHDDLPALDNDDLRRGKPTCHIVFGEATAILAGDALQSLAFELITSIHCRSALVLKMICILAKSIGSQGMIGGEALDIKMVNTQVSEIEL
jgi:geranylgeranyl pyrophosphate synthase